MNNPFEQLAETLGSRKDYFQGAGGNVSLKQDGERMLIKASGIRVSDMVSDDAAVGVAFPDIRRHFDETGPETTDDETNAIIKKSTHESGVRRPSIETGFHAILGTAVVHTHSVYANLLTCSAQFQELIKAVPLPLADSRGQSIAYDTVGYATPGHPLTRMINDVLKATGNGNAAASGMASGTEITRVIFMKNHGIAISAASLSEAMLVHHSVNESILAHFGITEHFPKSSIDKISASCFASRTQFLADFAKANLGILRDIQNHMLFPDLVVFCKELNIESREAGSGAKISIDPDTGTILYNTNEKEAAFIEENLLAYAYLMSTMVRLGLSPNFISTELADVIENMESEKYRKGLVS